MKKLTPIVVFGFISLTGWGSQLNLDDPGAQSREWKPTEASNTSEKDSSEVNVKSETPPTIESPPRDLAQDAAVLNVVRRFLKAGDNRSAGDPQHSFYTDPIHYFGLGWVSQREAARQEKAYEAKWRIRRYSFQGEPRNRWLGESRFAVEVDGLMVVSSGKEHKRIEVTTGLVVNASADPQIEQIKTIKVDAELISSSELNRLLEAIDRENRASGSIDNIDKQGIVSFAVPYWESDSVTVWRNATTPLHPESVRAEINSGHSSPIIAGSINEAQGSFVTASLKGEIICWDLKTQLPRRRLKAGMQIGGIELLDNGLILCIGGGIKTFQQLLKVFDSISGRQIGETRSMELDEFNTYGDPCRPSTISSMAGIVAGVGDERFVEVAPLNAWEQNDDKSSYVRVNLPAGDPNQLPVFCRFAADGKTLVVTLKKIVDGKSGGVNDWSFPWTDRQAAAGEMSNLTYNFEQRSWSDESPVILPAEGMTILDRSHHYFLASDLCNNTMLIAEEPNIFPGPQNRLPAASPNWESGISFDSESGWLFSKQTAVKPKSLQAKPSPLSTRNPTSWKLSNEGTVAIARFAELRNNETCWFFKIIDFDTGKELSIRSPEGIGFLGDFAIDHKHQRVIDASGATFSFEGVFSRPYDTLNRPNDATPTFVSSSPDGNVVAFGGLWHADIFVKSESEALPEKIRLGDIGVPTYPAVSPNGAKIAFAGTQWGESTAYVFDITTRTGKTYLEPDQVDTAKQVNGAFWLDQLTVAFTSETSTMIVDTATGRRSEWWVSGDVELNRWAVPRSSAPFRWASDPVTNKLFHQRMDSSIVMLSPTADGQIVELGEVFAPSPQKQIWFEPERLTYTATSQVLKGLHFVVNERDVYPFEQFSLRLNRPDIILQKIGAPAEAVAIAKQLRAKRLERMGVTEDMLKPDFHLPVLSITREIPLASSSESITIPISASDSRYELERLRVYVNNVPVNGRDGESLRALSTRQLSRDIPVKLANGRNKIQVSVVNSAGAESLYANVEVTRTASSPTKPVLYTVALGVSSYSNPEFDLRYAAKDARDIVASLHSSAGENYREVKSLCLTDRKVTREAIPQIRDFLAMAGINDTVIFFVAGHGLLDAGYNYYYATTDVDFDRPADRGVAFDELDAIMADVACLKKAMWIDTCHAGELDEEERTLLTANSGAGAISLPGGSGVAVRPVSTRGMNVHAIETAATRSEWYERLQGLFVDLRRGSGTTVLASSAGAEYALESSEQQNGLFTYALIEVLKGSEEADEDRNGSITISEAADYVKSRVEQLSAGKQNPNVRRVNLEEDFVLYGEE